MKILEKHPSPQKTLVLSVLKDSDDITLGFDGFDCHTHGNVLVGEYESIGINITTPEQATEKFIDDLKNDRVYLILRKKTRG